MAEIRYQIVRLYTDETHPSHLRVIRRGLTLDAAQAYCRQPSTHEHDAAGHTVWFDSYEEQGPHR